MRSWCQEEFCVPAGPGTSPVHVDGEAVAALSRFLAVFGGWLEHRAWQWIFHEVQHTAVPGARPFLVRNLDAAVGRGSSTADPLSPLFLPKKWEHGDWKSRRCSCLGPELGEHPLMSPLDFAHLISSVSQAFQFLPGVPVLSQEFQPNPILLRRDEGKVNS